MKRNCKKCNQTKDINLFPDMVDLNKSHDCKECRGLYLSTYYLANKQRIRDNERLRRARQRMFVIMNKSKVID